MILFKNNHYEEDERLFSTGNDELDDILEEVYYSGIEDGYDYAQREFSRNKVNAAKKATREVLEGLKILEQEGIRTDKITKSGVASMEEIMAAAKQAARKKAREIPLAEDINSKINRKTYAGSIFYNPGGALQRRSLDNVEQSGRHLKYDNAASKRGNILYNPHASLDKPDAVSTKNGAFKSANKKQDALNKWNGRIESIEDRKREVVRDKEWTKGSEEIKETLERIAARKKGKK